MKIKILVCDDSRLFIDSFTEELLKYGSAEFQLEIHGETDPSKLSDEELKTYDIAFLDVDLGAVNGMDLAGHMRSLKSKAILIFVTNYIEYSPEGYEVGAFRFLMKGQMKEKLPGYFTAAMDELKHRSDTFTFSTNGEPVSLGLRDIFYLESEGRKIHLHTKKSYRREASFYGTLDQLEHQLCPSGFLRIHKSYLVNLSYLESLHYNQAVMKDGTVLPVSQRRYAELRKQYINWKLYPALRG